MKTHVLVVTAGPLAGESFRLAASTTIGRAGDADIQLIDDAVSRRHACLIEQEDGRRVIRDLGSRNGTYVGSERIVEHVLTPGDAIRVGDSVLEFRESDSDELPQESRDIKLMSGPAVTSTVAITPEAASRMVSASRCCASPLAAEAIASGWAFCPGCGQAI